MKFIADVILFAAALSSVFFLAGLADVPRRVRYSVAAIGPGFLLTALLHVLHPKHVDYGLALIAIAVVCSAFFGYHHINTAELTREMRATLWKRFGIIFGITCVVVAIATAIILKLNTEKPQPVPAGTPTTPQTSVTVVIADSTEKAIHDFYNYKSPYND